MHKLLGSVLVTLMLVLGASCGEEGDENIAPTTEAHQGLILDCLNEPLFECYEECQDWYEACCPGCRFFVDPCADWLESP